MVGAGGISEDLGNIISDLIRFLVQACRHDAHLEWTSTTINCHYDLTIMTWTRQIMHMI